MQLIIGDKRFSSWSMRAWLAVKATGKPCEEVPVRLRQPDTRTQILRWSPSGKLPCLLEHGLAVWDSLAIAEYLAEEFPQLWPQDAAARALARSVSAEMHSGFAALRNEMSMDAGASLPGVMPSDACAADIARIQMIWEDCRRDQGLGGPYLFGAWSIADMMFAPVCLRFETYGVALTPLAQAYCQSVLAHPHVQAWKKAAQLERQA
ncbi:MAG: glutathione S-transferase [Candidatus Dactylopiibacterium carminicum]|uniref:Glutathione S-transferase n=1 Tax=Candidatus Dactylopiibacterium carminicum TaxID=857335 RepID=A0A272EUF6_9RHOO|nr:glutathione S-transferase family protein [Candidatus Dactylopiibacterium carminicum]KAF7599773.1 glutathione S-transferase [Candidatus Dactylopiibacterium carminicum]PAS93727.1 MAG: glutathione S-transferase [Candidatus Dactylopiibacterium carminicum]PAS98272.1 MAG: glutathione S-transferase [Candidatus Dactylopiibacterium carminicum]PAS99774.1 MAG: glutathione S-transferase [Candidatus Dactylopiibacterium carminicum]